MNSHLQRYQYYTSTTNDPSLYQQNWHYLIKILLLSICLLLDLILNSTSEFETFETYTKDQIHKIHILLCSIQILSQMSSFTILFSLLCDTFPFQVGLIGVLIKRFKVLLALELFYITLTLIICSIRLSKLQSGNGLTMLNLWNIVYYTGFSFTHKLVAPFYHAECLKAAIELGSTEYYLKSAWYDKVSSCLIQSNECMDEAKEKTCPVIDAKEKW